MPGKMEVFKKLVEGLKSELDAVLHYTEAAEVAEREGFKEISEVFKRIAFEEATHVAAYLYALANINEDIKRALGIENIEYRVGEIVVKLKERIDLRLK